MCGTPQIQVEQHEEGWLFDKHFSVIFRMKVKTDMVFKELFGIGPKQP